MKYTVEDIDCEAAESERSPYLPVEANRQQSKTFITVGSAKYTGECGAVRIRQTENGKPGKQWEDPLRKKFPDKYAVRGCVRDIRNTYSPTGCPKSLRAKCPVKHLEFSPRRLSTFEQGFEHRDERKHQRVQHFGWVQENGYTGRMNLTIIVKYLDMYVRRIIPPIP